MQVAQHGNMPTLHSPITVSGSRLLYESKIGEAKLDELIESTRGTIYRQGNPRDGL